nr:NAD(P)H-dependent oxidoreductase [Caulobacter sp. 602-1]
MAVIVGSLRKDSYTRRLAKALMALAPASLDCHIVEIGDLPLYTEDLDAAPPAAWTRFRQDISRADAVLFVTPEYNRSVPGGLKNAIDVGSRPPQQSVWDGLPAAVVSQSPYKLGGFGANHHIRQSLVFLNMPVLQQPEAYIPQVGELFDDVGELTAEAQAFLTRLVAAFVNWVALVGGARPSGAER